MKRRDLLARLVAAGCRAASLVLPVAAARAEAGPVEGVHYLRLTEPTAPPPARGQIDVIEFFWYGCPHCNAFEPALDAWQQRLPADVALRRSPVAFRAEPHTTHQRIFFALESLGLVAAMHRKVFAAIHGDHLRLDRLPDIVAFMADHGVDGAAFADAFNSFSVQSKARQATALAAQYRIDAVPALGIHGRWTTTGMLAGSNERMLAVADQLAQQIRKGA